MGFLQPKLVNVSYQSSESKVCGITVSHSNLRRVIAILLLCMPAQGLTPYIPKQ